VPPTRTVRHIPSRNGVRHRLRAPVVIGAISVGALAAGCGGANPSTGTSGSVNTGTVSSDLSASSTHTQALAYARCVRAHGVPLWPAPDSSGQFDKSMLTPGKLGVSSVEAATAQRACRGLQPTYSASQRSSQVVTGALRFSRCMRAHGSTNFPDPESNGAIVIPHAMESSPVYLAALRACIHKYGVPPPPSPSR
jgi:hypothetical protein